MRRPAIIQERYRVLSLRFKQRGLIPPDLPQDWRMAQRVIHNMAATVLRGQRLRVIYGKKALIVEDGDSNGNEPDRAS